MYMLNRAISCFHILQMAICISYIFHIHMCRQNAPLFDDFFAIYSQYALQIHSYSQIIIAQYSFIQLDRLNMRMRLFK